VDSLDLALLLVGAEPHADAHSLDLLTFDFVVHESHLDLQVGEILGDLTAGSLNGDDSVLAGNSDWKTQSQSAESNLPPAGIISHSSVKVCLILLYLLIK